MSAQEQCVYKLCEDGKYTKKMNLNSFIYVVCVRFRNQGCEVCSPS